MSYPNLEGFKRDLMDNRNEGYGQYGRRSPSPPFRCGDRARRGEDVLHGDTGASAQDRVRNRSGSPTGPYKGRYEGPDTRTGGYDTGYNRNYTRGGQRRSPSPRSSPGVNYGPSAPPAPGSEAYGWRDERYGSPEYPVGGQYPDEGSGGPYGRNNSGGRGGYGYNERNQSREYGYNEGKFAPGRSPSPYGPRTPDDRTGYGVSSGGYDNYSAGRFDNSNPPYAPHSTAGGNLLGNQPRGVPYPDSTRPPPSTGYGGPRRCPSCERKGYRNEAGTRPPYDGCSQCKQMYGGSGYDHKAATRGMGDLRLGDGRNPPRGGYAGPPYNQGAYGDDRRYPGSGYSDCR